MKRIDYRIVAGFLLAAIGFAPIDSPAADSAKSKAAQIQAKSSVSANAPLVARIVVTPSPEQMAKIRLERRMMGLENRATDGAKVSSSDPLVTGAL